MEYLVTQGRASQAFNLLSTDASLVLDSKTLQKAARRVAMYNLLDDGIVASAVALLDLFGEPTETLRVDVHCARTIGHSVAVRELFLNFDKGQSKLLSALKLLEESAWAKEPPIGADQAPAPGGFESPWHLVALFCRVHNLPRSLTLLHELARNGDWVMFLHESDLQQCPVETVRDVVQIYFDGASPLRSHLNILLDLKSVTSPKETSNTATERPWSSVDDQLVSEKIQNSENDHRIQLHKALSLFKFDKAKCHFEQLADTERGLIESYNCGPLKPEIERITAGTVKKPRPVRPSLSFDGEAMECSPSYGVTPGSSGKNSRDGENSERLIRRGLLNDDFSVIRGVVDSADAVEMYIRIISDFLAANHDLSLGTFENLLEPISEEYLEAFGDRLQSLVSQNTAFDMHRDTLTYLAYARAFVEEGKFEQLLGKCAHSKDSKPQKFPHNSVKPLRADGLLEHFRHLSEKSEFGVIEALHSINAYIKISRFYLQNSQTKRFGESNSRIENIFRNLRESQSILYGY